MSRGVVVDSYSQLVAEGYLSAKRGSATRVALLPRFMTCDLARPTFISSLVDAGKRRWCVLFASCRMSG